MAYGVELSKLWQCTLYICKPSIIDTSYPFMPRFCSLTHFHHLLRYFYHQDFAHCKYFMTSLLCSSVSSFKQPSCVILMMKIEKAFCDLWNHGLRSCVNYYTEDLQERSSSHFLSVNTEYMLLRQKNQRSDCQISSKLPLFLKSIFWLKILRKYYKALTKSNERKLICLNRRHIVAQQSIWANCLTLTDAWRACKPSARSILSETKTSTYH